MIEKPSFCRECGKPVFWREDLGKRFPVNARRSGEYLFPTEEKHFFTCPKYIRIREERDCPACQIEKSRFIDTIFKIDVDKPVCRIHVERKFFMVEDWGRSVRYPVGDFYELRKSLKRKQNREERTVEKRKSFGDFHALDRFVYEQG